MDWHHPDWGVRRAWNDRATGSPDMDRFNEYLKGSGHGDCPELPSGRALVLWPVGKALDQRRLLKDMYVYLRGLDPKLIINNRVGGGSATSVLPSRPFPPPALAGGLTGSRA